jgi:hypothetical protein
MFLRNKIFISLLLVCFCTPVTHIRYTPDLSEFQSEGIQQFFIIEKIDTIEKIDSAMENYVMTKDTFVWYKVFIRERTKKDK